MNVGAKQFLLKSGLVIAGGGFLGSWIYLGYMSTSAMRESPKDAFAHNLVKNVNHKKIMSQLNLDDLKKNGIVVIDNVLTPEELEKARNEVDALILNTSHFETNGHEDTEVRTDSVFWISEVVGNEQNSLIGSGVLHALRKVRSIPNELLGNGNLLKKNDENKDDTLFGVPFFNQLACYDGKKANYIPHRDAPEKIEGGYQRPLQWLLQLGLQEREMTIILYLNNETWDTTGDSTMEKDTNGVLRCYLNTNIEDMTGESATEVMDIKPIGGRMVIFDSRKILHEVCPSLDRRRAITCWVGGRHSEHKWLRPYCLPFAEVNWKQVRENFWKK